LSKTSPTTTPGKKRRRERRGQSAADRVGEQVAHLRKDRQLKVSELARMVGVSPSLISQIERGRSQASVATLFALAESLEVPVDAFFMKDGESSEPEPGETPKAAVVIDGAEPKLASEESAAVDMATTIAPVPSRPVMAGASKAPAQVEGSGSRYLVRRDSRAAISIEGGVRWERLTPRVLPHVDFLELIYEPGAASNAELYRHPGTEMVLVLEGTFEIFVGFERYVLAAGDSIHFPSSMPHRYVNPTSEPARAVTVILHDENPPRPEGADS
jgi:transcriptional regulator with XRE-family HTH domain/mannose-6-phosphate isomerase-like protein (cupin superfamily)